MVADNLPLFQRNHALGKAIDQIFFMGNYQHGGCRNFDLVAEETYQIIMGNNETYSQLRK